jgi:hypothetical protein
MKRRCLIGLPRRIQAQQIAVEIYEPARNR